jgi:hypothetical protein
MTTAFMRSLSKPSQPPSFSRSLSSLWGIVRNVTDVRPSLQKIYYYYYLKCLLGLRTFYIIFLWRITVRALIYGNTIFLKYEVGA